MADQYINLHPELHEAIAYGLEALVNERPSDPFAFLAEKLLAFASGAVNGSYVFSVL